jgi:membrane dipeptidase
LPDELTGGKSVQDEPCAHVTGPLEDFGTWGGHLSLDGTAGFEWCQCLAVFLPDDLDVPQSADFFERVSSTLATHVKSHPDRLAQVRGIGEVDAALGTGRMAGMLTVENGKLLAAGSDMVKRIDAAGVRMLTLTWNAMNPLGSGHESEEGLTSFGRSMVNELEAHHIVVDVSHLNDPGFADVSHVAQRPFVASHSNSRAICDVPRNLTDDQFRAIRDAGGIVGLNLYRSFLSTEHDDPTPDDVCAHVEHWLDLDGEDVVALGTDNDGCTTPSWLPTCRSMDTLASVLSARFGHGIADKLLFSNAHTFFERAWQD